MAEDECFGWHRFRHSLSPWANETTKDKRERTSGWPWAAQHPLSAGKRKPALKAGLGAASKLSAFQKVSEGIFQSQSSGAVRFARCLYGLCCLGPWSLLRNTCPIGASGARVRRKSALPSPWTTATGFPPRKDRLHRSENSRSGRRYSRRTGRKVRFVSLGS